MHVCMNPWQNYRQGVTDGVSVHPTIASLPNYTTAVLPISLLVEPLRKRFQFHFYGNKQTNNADKVSQLSLWGTALSFHVWARQFLPVILSKKCKQTNSKYSMLMSKGLFGPNAAAETICIRLFYSPHILGLFDCKISLLRCAELREICRCSLCSSYFKLYILLAMWFSTKFPLHHWNSWLTIPCNV